MLKIAKFTDVCMTGGIHYIMRRSSSGDPGTSSAECAVTSFLKRA